MTSRFRWLFALVLAMMSPGPNALADKYGPPVPYKKEVPGGKFVFVMIATIEVNRDRAGWAPESDEVKEIRRTYKRSGLYRSDNSDEPLWTVDWFDPGIPLASDGVHLIRTGHSRFFGSEGVSFYSNGKLLQAYLLRELVDDTSRMGRSVTTLDWMREGWLDERRMEYTLETWDGNRFVFDVRTGEMLSDSRTGRIPAGRVPGWVWWSVFGVVAVGIVARIGWRRRIRPRAKR